MNAVEIKQEPLLERDAVLKKDSGYWKFRRFQDVFLSILAILVLWPFMLLVALIVVIDSPGAGPIFAQTRIGRDGKPFTFYKFRSMKLDTPKYMSTAEVDDPDKYITRVGKFIRKTSLDEIPQFFNTLVGDMSFIGPRPPLTYHPWPIEEYSEEQLRMFDTRPGITGWAQVNGRKGVEWNKRIELNVWYVDNVSFLLDLKIVFMTIFKVFSNSDNENTTATVVTKSEKETVNE